MSAEYFHVQLRQEVHVAIPVKSTVEVSGHSFEHICPVPGVDPVLLGVVNWRGHLLWNVDLSDFLGVKADIADSLPLVSTRASIVIADGRSHRRLCCWVNRLVGMMTLTEHQIKPVPKKFPASVIPYSAGWIKSEIPLLVLDPIAVLDSARWHGEIAFSQSA
ncbi:MAG: chemotaxis protein CheW [Leptolyngbyaceae bacterium]|nr:chemotaxis protein CheW [Leptolyngbyaceae bacterium]